MTKGFWILRIDVDQPDRYGDYVDAAGPAYKKYGAKILVRGGEFELVEGTARARNVIIEFPSYQAALDCYHDSAYQAAAKIRQAIAQCDVIIIKGAAD